MMYTGFPPSVLDHEMDVPHYQALCRQWRDIPPVAVTVARSIAGLKPYEEPITDPDEARRQMAAFVRS